MRPEGSNIESVKFAREMAQAVEDLPTIEKPVATWLLDIDGVVNVIGRPPRHGWGRYEHTVLHAFEGLAWSVCYSPMLVKMLNTLAAKNIVSFRWLTTWEYDGPKKFAPAVGLDIGAWVAAEDDNDNRTWWKLRAFEATAAEVDHLLIWTDDDQIYYSETQQVTDFLNRDIHLAICPESRRGLMPADFSLILAALKMWLRLP